MRERYGDESDDDVPNIADLFPFLISEQELIQALSTELRNSLPSMEAGVLRKVSVLLFALERLPYTTPGVSIDLAIVDRGEYGSSYVSVELTDQAFRLSQGGSEYSPGVGSDSYSSRAFQLEAGGFREGSTTDFEDWLDAFRRAVGTYSIQDVGDEVDLSASVPNDGWDRLAAYWDMVGWTDL